METTMDTLMITIESAAKDASKQVDTLTTKLDNLRTSLSNLVSESKNISKLTDAIKNTASVSSKTSSIKKTVDEYKNLDDVLGSVKLTRETLGKKLGETVSGDGDTITTITKYKTELGGIATVTDKNVNGFHRFKASIKSATKDTEEHATALDLLKNKMAATIAKGVVLGKMFKNIGKTILSFVRDAADYEESLNLFTVTMGENAEQGTKWIERFSNALYLDQTEVMQYMGSFNSLIKGLGTASDKAYLMSKNLTQLTYDLASFKNIKPEVAFQKLQSAMSGEIEPLRNIGVALSENTLQELAYSLGLEANVRDLTEAQKAQLRYIQIMKSSTEWQTDMGRTLVTPANALRIVKQEFTMLSRAIGRVFIPVVMSAMPYVIALSQVLTDLANRLASLLGYEIADIDYSKLTDGLKDLSTGVSDIGDAADKTKKQLNTMLAPFDELNVVQEQVKKTGSGLGDSLLGGDLGLDLPEYDALANLTRDMEERVENARKNLNKIKNIAIAIGGAIGLWKLANFISDIQKTTGLAKSLKKVVLGIGLITVGITLGKIGDQDIKNKDTFLKGLGEQLGGSLAFGAGVWLLTGNLKVGLIVAGIDLFFHGVQTMMDSDNFLAGLAETLGGIFTASGSTFSLLKGSGLSLKANLTVTLAVTAVIVWGAVFEEIGKLKEMDPTNEELRYGIEHMWDDVPIMGDWVEDLSTRWSDEIKVITDTFTTLKDGWKDTVENIVSGWDSLQTDTSTAAENIKTDLSTKWDEIKTAAGDRLTELRDDWSTKWNEIKTNAVDAVTNLTTDLSTKWNEIKTAAGDRLTELRDDWSTKWNEIKTNVSTTFENIHTDVSTKWEKTKSWLEEHIGTKDDWKQKFDTILSGASSVLTELKDKFENWKANLKAPHMTWDPDGWKATGTLKKVLSTINLPTTLPKLKVDWYKDGGFPTSADLFFANENGVPEMVGRIGNQTAVANQDQITTSITNALLQALNQYDFGNNQPSRIVVNIGGKKMYDGYGDYINSETDRYGTTTLNI